MASSFGVAGTLKVSFVYGAAIQIPAMTRGNRIGTRLGVRHDSITNGG